VRQDPSSYAINDIVWKTLDRLEDVAAIYAIHRLLQALNQGVQEDSEVVVLEVPRPIRDGSRTIKP
jgi:hypothetical protein